MDKLNENELKILEKKQELYWYLNNQKVRDKDGKIYIREPQMRDKMERIIRENVQNGSVMTIKEICDDAEILMVRHFPSLSCEDAAKLAVQFINLQRKTN